MAGTFGGVLWTLWYVGVPLAGEEYQSYETYNTLMPVVPLLCPGKAVRLPRRASRSLRGAREGRVHRLLCRARVYGRRQRGGVFGCSRRRPTQRPMADFVKALRARSALPGRRLGAFRRCHLEGGDATAPRRPAGCYLVAIGVLGGVLSAVTGLLAADSAFSPGSSGTLGAAWVMAGYAVWSDGGRATQRSVRQVDVGGASFRG